MINTKTNRSNLFVELSKQAKIIEKLRPFLKSGGYHIAPDGRICPNADAIAWDIPWVHVKSHPSQRCDIGHHIIWKYFKFIPSFCRKCYKVVVRPRNLVELFDLYELQREMGVPCKCGTEPRQTVHGLYGGYFYCFGIEEGKKRYKQVRQLVNERLSPETSVILKRYCTEFEIGPDALGPSDEIAEQTEEEWETEKLLDAIFPDLMHRTSTPDYMVAYVMKQWIHDAYRWGDKTYSEFTKGSPLFAPTVTYHDKED